MKKEGLLNKLFGRKQEEPLASADRLIAEEEANRNTKKRSVIEQLHGGGRKLRVRPIQYESTDDKKVYRIGRNEGLYEERATVIEVGKGRQVVVTETKFYGVNSDQRVATVKDGTVQNKYRVKSDRRPGVSITNPTLDLVDEAGRTVEYAGVHPSSWTERLAKKLTGKEDKHGDWAGIGRAARRLLRDLE